VHHVLLSHGLAVPVLRAASPGCSVGITLNLVPGYAASPSNADADAMRHFDGFFNRWYLDPIFGRGYPADKVADYQREGALPDGPLPFVEPGDMEAMAFPTDFLGINYYSRAIIRDEKAEGNLPAVVQSTGVATEMGWEVVPEALEKLLIDLRDEYGPKSILITENGAAYGTAPDGAGVIDDVERQAYFRGHIAAVGRARDAGVPVDGYFAWSLLDNFEWAFGYEKRFGLIWVDYETQERIPKQSAHLYRDIIAKAVAGEVAP
jgi:beta-glucosidase